MDNNELAIIIVLFNPNAEELSNIRNIARSYDGVIIDNSSLASFADSKVGKMEYFYDGKNKGIAEAQNIGIKRCLQKENVKYILFLDQDSEVNPDFPVQMVEEFKRVQHFHPNLILLGPTVLRKTNNQKYKSVIHKDVEHEEGFIVRRDVISSGSCIWKQHIKDVGLNDESLFIDFVDYEWCWRAEAKGFTCGISDNITIKHKVGQRELKFPFGYRVILSSPIRYFYQYRNYLWLCLRNYVPTQWKIATGIKLLSRLIYFPLFVKTGIKCWKYMIKGIVAAINTSDPH